MREVRLCFGRSQLRLPKKSCFKDGQLAVSIRGPTKQLSSDLTNIFYPACDKLTRSFKSTPDCRRIFKSKRQSEWARIHRRLGKDAREAQLLESVVDARLGCCLCSSSQSLHNAQAPSISKQVVAAAHLRPGQYRPRIVGEQKKSKVTVVVSAWNYATVPRGWAGPTRDRGCAAASGRPGLPTRALDGASRLRWGSRSCCACQPLVSLTWDRRTLTSMDVESTRPLSSL